ncbi:MAG: ATP-grasp domain-containing protein [Parachlamydiales bacterium]|nr:ATP-grasp domain-containing protein [Parachlamydiales bacterium]
MRQKIIALWMYRNEGGDVIQEKLKKLLEEKNIKVINDFDMRNCYCFNGRVYTDNNFDLSSVDVLYHMNADEQSPHQNQILKALELSGVKVVNSWDSYNTARNKFWTNTLLKRNGINVPPAIFVNSTLAYKMADKIFNEWNSVVVKPQTLHGGKGIIKFDDLEQFKDYIEATQDFIKSYYIEKFIDFNDVVYRIEIINNNIVSKYCLSKKIHSYKTNIHSGGKFIPNIPTKEFEEIALKASEIIDLKATIIDMIKIEKFNKIYVLEVNPFLGMFLESFQLYSDKLTDRIIYDSMISDNKKVIFLTNYLISCCK